MKVRYFTDTDTLLMELRDSPVAETREFDDDMTLDLDLTGASARSRSNTRLSVQACLRSPTNRAAHGRNCAASRRRRRRDLPLPFVDEVLLVELAEHALIEFFEPVVRRRRDLLQARLRLF